MLLKYVWDSQGAKDLWTNTLFEFTSWLIGGFIIENNFF